MPLGGPQTRHGLLQAKRELADLGARLLQSTADNLRD
jgi:hypothetical protein